MHKKLVLALFIVVIAAIAIIFLQQKYKQAPGEEKIMASRIVIPQIEHSAEEDDSPYLDTEKTSLVPLNSDETLLATVDMDFDGDGQDDEISAVRTAGNPFISLIVGLFSPQKGEFERVATIATPIRQLSTFSYTGIDLTGTHKNSLVYQGTVDTGKSILQAFFIDRNEEGVSITQIANLEGDNTIYVDLVERSDAYLMAAANAPSFTIWVYSTNPETKTETESKYDWDIEKQQYVLIDQPHDIAPSKHNNPRQNGSSTDSYFTLLDGLWYKIDGTKGDMHYLYVDKELKQFLFLDEEQYELYEWVRSTPRNNGIYITAKNDEITNFQRQIDISFNGPDQFKLRVVDFLFIVSDGNPWNGEYKKMADATSYLKSMNEKVYKFTSFVEKLRSTKWTTPDGIIITFDNGTYTAEGENIVDKGSYTALDDGSKPFIQFRSTTETPMFKKTYLMSRQEKQKDDILLQPYVLSPDQSYPADDHVIILSPYEEKE